MIRKIILSVLLASFLTACAHIPGGIAASNIPLDPNGYITLGDVEGNDCAYSILLGLIPISDGNETKDAMNDALSKIPGTTALIGITSDSYSQSWIIWSNVCTQVYGTAVKQVGESSGVSGGNVMLLPETVMGSDSQDDLNELDITSDAENQ